ncbi:MAG: hypothetical protein LBT37_06055 [Lactobacillaceae bacterium]|jgi:hypothetical protein|nr:hypothetical protein [Lactobacillaceae bacterium]
MNNEDNDIKVSKKDLIGVQWVLIGVMALLILTMFSDFANFPHGVVQLISMLGFILITFIILYIRAIIQNHR